MAWGIAMFVPAPATQPPGQAIPSIRQPFFLPALASSSIFRHSNYKLIAVIMVTLTFFFQTFIKWLEMKSAAGKIPETKKIKERFKISVLPQSSHCSR